MNPREQAVLRALTDLAILAVMAVVVFAAVAALDRPGDEPEPLRPAEYYVEQP